MPINADSIRNKFNEVFKYGQQVRIKYYTGSLALSSYDDDVALTLVSGPTGTIWTSGIIQPISNARSERGAELPLLLEQGKIIETDHILYLPGSRNLSGQTIKIGVGSPVQYENTIVPAGIWYWNINGSVIYQKVYIRSLTNGSMLGE